MFPRLFDNCKCHFPFDWRTSLLSSRDSFIPAARTCRLRRADRIQVATMSHIIPLYLELTLEIPTPASFLCPFENHHSISKHAEPIPSRPRYGAAILLCLVLLPVPSVGVLGSVKDGKLAISMMIFLFMTFLYLGGGALTASLSSWQLSLAATEFVEPSQFSSPAP